jgi:hypothetical protein
MEALVQETFENYTPHEMTLQLADGERVTLPSKGSARVAEISLTDSTSCNGAVELRRITYGAIEGLPQPVPEGKR